MSVERNPEGTQSKIQITRPYSYTDGTTGKVITRMPIQSLTPPKQQRQSRYDYTEDDVNTALDMLADLADGASEDAPGDGPFATEGEARSAGHAMVTAMGSEGDNVGVRVWSVGETKPEKRKRGDKTITVQAGEFYFALKNGKRKVSSNGDSADE